MPETVLTPDLCVIGAGSGGLVAAAGASQMGASVVLIEAGAMGGDCLNTGCVPSKALLAAGHAAQRLRRPGFGLAGAEPDIDFAAVMEHVQRTIAAIAPNDSVVRFEGLGVTVRQGVGRFTGPDEVTVDGTRVRARRFVVATGAAPLVPDLPGLGEVRYLTHETVWALRERPAHLLVLGGGPVGVELAQAFRRLGSAVTIVEAARLLPREDEELVDVIRLALRRDGILVLEGAAVERVSGAVSLHTSGGTVSGSHLLIAVGRRPRVAGLGLELAKIAHSDKGIQVDAGLRTTNRRVYAIGDVTGGPQFTHLAGHQAGLVLRSALFRLPVRNDLGALPAVTYTDPELARVGPTEAEARAAHGKIQILRWALADVDRARIDGAPAGLCKVLLDRRGKVVGAAIAGRHAGELILPWVLAVRRRLPVTALADLMAPYPTLGELTRKAAASYLMPKLFSDRVKTVVRWLARLG